MVPIFSLLLLVQIALETKENWVYFLTEEEEKVFIQKVVLVDFYL